MARFIVAPEWQGSPAARAMLLARGAEIIAGDLPRAATTVIEIPVEAGDAVDTGIRRYSAVQRVAEAIAAELDEAPGIVIGGDCGVAVAAVSDSVRRHPGAAVLWFDAHADLHTVATSPSGAFAGMALRAATGDGPGAAAHPASLDRVVLVGTRAWDEAESELLDAGAVRSLGADASPEAIADAVAATGATAVHVHVDVDVLDPAEFSGVTDAVPFGMSVAGLTRAIATVRARVPLAGASLAGFAPASDAAAIDDMGSVLRVIGALA